ncbi:O-methyltransferase [Alkalicoccobacillus murimartini]|uniref:tRNA 5-hydroxyuridine methyltransferase n=1 Tax=Alkalicoccobacillus murimartini TaxID=171685 RepID=A0ABT9YCJ7_9BACI|nr:O-methyltransferase [Alkalicoccobacillus murimartini]MDQ0205449.1 putative O-methyltransferase YrrM [Alkalicoccobacillus murimartini]
MFDQKTTDYLVALTPKRSELLEQMEAYAEEHGVPIMDLVGIESLLQLLQLHSPKRILEIGTAIGYSAIRMAEVLPEAEIVTIERDSERAAVARTNIKEANLSNRIHLIEDDALNVVEILEKMPLFHVLFIDAAKGQYQRFFDQFSPLLAPGGIIFSDNVLFRGLVAEQDIESKRLSKLAGKINAYNQYLMEHPDFHTRILPIGDGLAVSIKK